MWNYSLISLVTVWLHILIPLFTLSSVYGTYASGAKEMAETNRSNIIKHNRVKNPNWLEANQLAIYKRGQELFWTQDYCEQIHLAVRSGVEHGASELQVQRSNRLATLPP